MFKGHPLSFYRTVRVVPLAQHRDLGCRASIAQPANTSATGPAPLLVIGLCFAHPQSLFGNHESA
jgi:hypothetical protein